MKPDDYKAWTEGSTSGMSLAQNGERLFASMGCNACHSGDASARGPNLAAAYMTKVQLTERIVCDGGRRLPARFDFESDHAHDGWLCADHADIPGADQRRRIN